MVALWAVATGSKIREFDGGLVHADFRLVGFSKDGTKFVALDGGYTSSVTVAVWDTATGRRAVRPAGHEGAVTHLAYSPDGKWLASGSVDKSVHLWNAETREHVNVLATHGGPVSALAFSLDGKHLASASDLGSVRVYDVKSQDTLAVLNGPDRGVVSPAFTTTGDRLCATAGNGELLAWDLSKKGEPIRGSLEAPVDEMSRFMC